MIGVGEGRDQVPLSAPHNVGQALPQIDGARVDALLPRARFPIVGIGASAGGLGAFEAFFAGIPAATDPDMAFVLIQHLAHDHKSLFSELIRRYTRMQVFEAEDGMVVAPNCAYIIPPNRHMAFMNGTLKLLEPAASQGHRLPIDFFFTSLARDQHERAIGIVLSGTGSDGTAGVRSIKSAGGMVMAQHPASTEFDGMPRSAIDTGLVDYQLPPADMPAQLFAYAARAFGRSAPAAPETATNPENALNKLFQLLRTQTGHDFSLYKPSTIRRRIERRMAVHQVDTLDDYVQILRQTDTEADALFNDLLIGVTNFFRDESAFRALAEEAIPRIFEHKRGGDAIRVWCTGCSTGEEAYSIAILLRERMDALRQTFKVQLFGTDIDSRAIATARNGVYPLGIANDVSSERLARFFTLEPDGLGYRVHMNIRDMVVFSKQDMIKDPPLSRLDLVSCRNLLIYMGAELQKQLLPLFHYTLNPNGFLFLGSSETVGEFGDLFGAVDHKAKLFKRRSELIGSNRVGLGRTVPSLTAYERTAPTEASGAPGHPKLSLRDLTEQALLKRSPLSALLVNAQGDILYQHGRTGLYLEPAPGEAGINNALRMAREGLRRELVTALHQATRSHAAVYLPQLRVKTNGHFSLINLGIEPVRTIEGSDTMLFLVSLEEVPTAAMGGPASLTSATHPGTHVDPGKADGAMRTSASDFADVGFDRHAAAATIAALNEELRANREYLQATNEELRTSNEELKSSNGEMQSVNEELQSTNEELETSKEEMQSINEELATVNSDLQTKVVDLSRANSDMKNLLACTNIATIFVDHQLRVLRYTPTATRIINLIPSDIGRPVAHTVSNLVGYTGLVADGQKVLDTLVPLQLEVESADHCWYTMRIQPYRTCDNVVEGLVITFVDISDIVHARQALSKTNGRERLAVVVRDAFDAITVQDLDGRVLAWNPAAVKLYGWSESEALMLNARDRIPPAQAAESSLQLQRLAQDELVTPLRTMRLHRNGDQIPVWLNLSALVDGAGVMYAVATTERAIVGDLGDESGQTNSAAL